MKSSAVSFAKKMPPLTDALTVGPDAIAVRACVAWSGGGKWWVGKVGGVNRQMPNAASKN